MASRLRKKTDMLNLWVGAQEMYNYRQSISLIGAIILVKQMADLYGKRTIKNRRSRGRISPPYRDHKVHGNRRPRDRHQNIVHRPDIVLGAELDPCVGG